MKAGIQLHYSEDKIKWFDCSIPLHPSGGQYSKDSDAMENMFFTQNEDEIFGEDWLQCYATEILDTKHEQTEVADAIDKLIDE